MYLPELSSLFIFNNYIYQSKYILIIKNVTVHIKSGKFLAKVDTTPVAKCSNTKYKGNGTLFFMLKVEKTMHVIRHTLWIVFLIFKINIFNYIPLLMKQ